MRDEVFSFYSKSKPERVPLSQQKEFKPVRNMVIREVVQMMEQLQDEGVEYNKPHQTVPNKEKMMPALLANAILLFTAAESIENFSHCAVLPAILPSNPFPSYPLISASGSRFGSARF